MKIIKHGYVTPEGTYPTAYNAWPTVISLADGTLLAGWSGQRLKHICPFGKVLAARSTDGGYTWCEPYLIQQTPLDDRDCGLCLAGDRILMTSFATGRVKTRHYQTHWLHGVRSTEEKELVEAELARVTDADEQRYAGPTMAYSTDGGYTFTPPKHMPLTSPHGPLYLKDGRIFHVGSLGSTEQGVPGVYYAWLDKECNLLQPPTPLMLNPDKDTIACEPYAAQMPNGDILVGIRVQNKNKLLYTVYLSRSTDGGKTFSEPQPTGWHGIPPHFFVTKSGAVIAAYACRESHQMGIHVRVSRDNGLTWGEELTLRDDCVDWDFGYPTTTENQNGELVTVYYMKDKNDRHTNRICYTVWNLE
jgi:hypothetical protein